MEYWEIFKNIYFEEQLWTATSEVLNKNPLRNLHFLIRNALLFLEQALTTSLRLTVMDLTYKWSDSICNSEKLEKTRANHNVYWSIIVQMQHFQLQKYQINAQNKSLLNGLPYLAKYILQTGKLKVSVLMKSNEGSFTDVFKGAEF